MMNEMELDVDAMERRLRAVATRERFRFPNASVPSDFRRAAVLIAFWREADDLFVVLTERASRMRTHAGMVAFPGGQLDPGEDWRAAALREAHEEVGLDPASVEILGELDDAWSGAKHHLVPVVAWLDRAPTLHANLDEVARLIVLALRDVMQPDRRSDATVYLGELACVNTTIEVDDAKIFGLTADLLLEAIEWSLGEAPTRGQTRLRELEAATAARGTVSD